MQAQVGIDITDVNARLEEALKGAKNSTEAEAAMEKLAAELNMPWPTYTEGVLGFNAALRLVGIPTEARRTILKLSAMATKEIVKQRDSLEAEVMVPENIV